MKHKPTDGESHETGVILADNAPTDEVADDLMREEIRKARAFHLAQAGRDTTASTSDASGTLLSEALKQAGKGEDEIKAVKDVDDAQTAANKNRMKRGAVQRALVSKQLPLALFARRHLVYSPAVNEVRERSLAVGQQFLAEDKLFHATGEFNPDLESALTDAGFYGLLIPTQFGGSGATMQEVGAIMLEIGRKISPVIPGSLSIKTMIGPVGALRYLCTPEQQEGFLSWMATKMFQGAFAATEPGHGCDITKIRTIGVIAGDKLRIWGEKVFISRAVHGGWVAIFLKVNGKLKVAIAQLPEQNTETFRLRKYNLHVLQPELMNNGLLFNGFEIPIENLLPGDGLAAIFHDLDDGRWAVAIGGSVLMTVTLASCPQWVTKRKTMGQTLATRQGIQYRMALIAAYLAGSDALSLGVASQIDEHCAGDVLAMIAKNWSTDRLREVMTIVGIEIQGGRVFVKSNGGNKGNPIGNNIMNALVTTVYEGPKAMLAMAAINLILKAIQAEGLTALHEELGKAGVNMFELMPKKVKKTSKIAATWAWVKTVAKVLWDHRGVHGAIGLSNAGRLYIHNKSPLGIYVNGEEIATSTNVVINPSDVITLGEKGPRVKLEIKNERTVVESIHVNGTELYRGKEMPIGGLFKNRKTIIPAARKFGAFFWNVKRSVKHGKVSTSLFQEELGQEAQLITDERFAKHLNFAAKAWFKWRSDILDLLFKYGERLADEQLVLEFDMYEPVESIVTMLRAVQEGQEALDTGDYGTASALNMLCAVLKANLEGKKRTTWEIKAAVKETFAHIMDGSFRQLAGVPVAEICLDYLDE